MVAQTKNLVLDVYLCERIVGTLTKKRSGVLEYAYEPSWLDHPDAFPISQSLPLLDIPYRGDRVSAFFDNLLPDNPDTKQRMARTLKAESAKPFDLLSVSGRDCVGAFLFVPHGAEAPRMDPVGGCVLKEGEIESLLKNLALRPLGNDEEEEFRISLAGTQEKTALLWYRRRWRRPKGTAPTSHILKPPLGTDGNLSTSVENEWLCAHIVKGFNLDVANAEIKQFGSQKCLVVERFDREWSKDKKVLHRVPQEDLCQALGIGSVRKYESDGGPGIKDVMDLLNASDRAGEDRKTFLKSQLVFFLLAAIDGHAKNFSIFHTKTGFRLAPLYDILSAHPMTPERRFGAKLAMAIGCSRHYRLSKISRRHWFETAKMCSFPKKRMEAIFDEVRAEADALFERGVELPPEFPRNLYDGIMGGLKRSLERLS